MLNSKKALYAIKVDVLFNAIWSANDVWCVSMTQPFRERPFCRLSGVCLLHAAQNYYTTAVVNNEDTQKASFF